MVVHCHSLWSTDYASAGIEILCLTVQTIEKIWPYAVDPAFTSRAPTLGGPQTYNEISPVFHDPAVFLANHGTISVGSNLMKAQYIAEIIEQTAHIAYVRVTLRAAHSKTADDPPQYGTAADARAAAE